jgi:hypothetical protein
LFQENSVPKYSKLYYTILPNLCQRFQGHNRKDKLKFESKQRTNYNTCHCEEGFARRGNLTRWFAAASVALVPPEGYFLAAEQESTQRSRLRESDPSAASGGGSEVSAGQRSIKSSILPDAMILSGTATGKR